MEVRKIKVGYLQTNCYILVEEGKCLIIDPGDQFYSIEEQIKGCELIGILITHRHPDHIRVSSRVSCRLKNREENRLSFRHPDSARATECTCGQTRFR